MENYEYIEGNTIDSIGLDKLKSEIIKKVNLENINDKDLTYLSNVRQIDLLKKSLNALNNAIKNLNNNIPVDMIEIDITECFNYLGEITGETYKDELIDTLFENFCLGK